MQRKKEFIKLFALVMLLIILPYGFIQIINAINKHNEIKDDKFFNLSNATKSEEFCFKIKNIDKRNNCFLEVGKAKRDTRVCERITEKEQCRFGLDIFNIMDHPCRLMQQNQKGACKTEIDRIIKEDALGALNYSKCGENPDCQYTVAIELNDTTYCDGFKEKRDSCLSEISKKKKQIEICKKIVDNTTKEDCYYFFLQFTREPSLCELIPEEKKKDCYYSMALNLTAAVYCEHAGNNTGDCFFTIAQKTNTSSYCPKAREREAECWEHFALMLLDENFCKLSGDAQNCYYKLAFEAGDKSFCEKSGENRNNCIYNFALNNSDPSLCLQLDIAEETCPGGVEVHYTMAYACRLLKDPVSSCIYITSNTTAAYCKYISDEYYRFRCNRNVAVSTSNLALCNQAGDFKENCYFEIAIKEKQIELCEKAGPWRSECVQKVQNVSLSK